MEKNLYNLAKVSRNQQNGKNNSTEKPQRVIKENLLLNMIYKKIITRKEIKYKKDPPKSKLQPPPPPPPQKGKL